MNFLEAIYDFISNIIGQILSNFTPMITAINSALTSAQTTANQVNTSLNSIPVNTLSFIFVGSYKVLIYLFCAVITGIIWVLNSFLSSIQFLVANPDLATYIILTLGMNVAWFFPSYQAFAHSMPAWFIPAIFAIFAMPFALVIWNYFALKMNASDSIQSAKHTILSPNFSIITDNLDVIVYILSIAFLSSLFLSSTIYTTIHELLPKFIFFTLIGTFAGFIALPVFVMIYNFSQGDTNFTNLLSDTRTNSATILYNNLDIAIYLIVLSLFATSLMDGQIQGLIHELLPAYISLNLYLLFGLILSFPIMIILYYLIWQQKTPITNIISAQVGGDTSPTTTATGPVTPFGAFLLFRQDVNNIKNNLQAIQNNLFKITTNVRPPQDPNPNLTDTERMFYAQLFADNPNSFPSKVYYPGSISNYSGSYQSVLPKTKISYKSTPGIYDKLYYEDLNLEFYGNANYQESLYSQFFGTKMTRADYIATPFTSLSANSLQSFGGLTISATTITKLTNLVFDCLNVDPTKYKTLKAVPDYVLQSFATGQYCGTSSYTQADYICFSAIGSRAKYSDPAGTAWPSLASQKILWPTVIQIQQQRALAADGTLRDPDTNIVIPTTDARYMQYVANCNQAFIYYSFSELINNLNNVGSGFNESLERWNLYLKIWGADDLTNSVFTKAPNDLMGYVYTFSDCSKNIVMFNDFLSYSLLPTSSESALSNQSLSVDNAYTSQVYNLIQLSSDPNSSANLFAVADSVLELIAAGISLSSILGLYNNVRVTNANFLFDREKNPNNPLAVLSNGSLSSIPAPAGTGGTYSPDTLSAIDEANQAAASGTLVGTNVVTASAQIQAVISSFAQNVSSNNIELALQNAPSQSGNVVVDGVSVPNAYGSPYIRRLFYDAAGVLSTVYSDLFSILHSNVFISGSQYVPNANDPIDMMWFRYTVQNWNNPFDGTRFGDGKYAPKTDKVDGSDSYICGGYQDGGMHQNTVFSVLGAVSDKLYTNSSGTSLGIYDRIFSLLDSMVAYNNIIQQAFTLGILGSTATAMLNNLINNLSNKYLRLQQNDRYMDLTSLLPGNVYQHFHLNINLGVPKFATNTIITANTKLSSIANLNQWISDHVSLDSNYYAFKNEVTTAYIFKLVWDMVWWPQFCYEFYYRDGNNNPAKIHRYNYINGGIYSNDMYWMGNGQLASAMYNVFQDLGTCRTNSSFFSSNNSDKLQNLYNLINGSMPSDHTRGLNTGQYGISNVNPFMWKSFCYSHRHDLLIPYTMFTGTIFANNQSLQTGALNYSSLYYSNGWSGNNDYYIKGLPNTNSMQDFFQSYSAHERYDLFMGGVGVSGVTQGAQGDLNQNSIDQNALSPYRWLSAYTSIGSQSAGTQFPKQMIMDKRINNYHYVADDYAGIYAGTLGDNLPIPPSPQLYTKFAPFASDKKIMRTQFFADPFSWFDTTKSYQIYPISYGATDNSNQQYLGDGVTTNWLHQEYTPMVNRWNGGFGWNDFYHEDYWGAWARGYTPPETAYAPIMSTGMVNS